MCSCLGRSHGITKRMRQLVRHYPPVRVNAVTLCIRQGPGGLRVAHPAGAASWQHACARQSLPVSSSTHSQPCEQRVCMWHWVSSLQQVMMSQRDPVLQQGAAQKHEGRACDPGDRCKPGLTCTRRPQLGRGLRPQQRGRVAAGRPVAARWGAACRRRATSSLCGATACSMHTLPFAKKWLCKSEEVTPPANTTRCTGSWMVRLSGAVVAGVATQADGITLLSSARA